MSVFRWIRAKERSVSESLIAGSVEPIYTFIMGEWITA